MKGKYLKGISVLLGVLCLLMVAGSSFAASDEGEFNHQQTGFPLDGAHEKVKCETCHIYGTFKGTPKRCIGCHEQGAFIPGTIRPVRHLRSTNECQKCHTTQLFPNITRVDHMEVIGTCYSCHNSVAAQGKKPSHIPSQNQCDACHRTTTFSVVRTVDHQFVQGACFDCHNGNLATGKSAGHIPSVNACEVCHTTRNWEAF